MQPKSSKKAFSIIELSVVAIIIALLIGGISASHRLVLNAKLTAARALTKSSPVKDIDNLSVWYETTMPQSIDNLSADDGQTVSTWYDLSPEGINSSGSATYIGEGINGLPVLRFNGSSNRFTLSQKTLSKTSYTVFIVAQRRSSKSNNFMIGSNSISNDVFSFGHPSSTSLQTKNNSDFSYSVTVAGYSTPIAGIYVSSHDVINGKKMYYNGTQIASHSNTVNCISSTSSVIGKYSSTYYSGDIAEIIMISKSLTDNERKDIEQYLSNKWKITLS